MMYQHSVINGKHVPSGGDVDNGGGYECWGWGAYAESLYLLLNFAVNSKLL